MSITRIHAIKATVKRSVDYICNPKKTDSGLLVYAFGTEPSHAALSFQKALEKSGKSDPNLAYHLIQSFAPGEVSAQEAHEIGKELAERLLGGKYSYVLSTHTDKGHVHNHLIFCAADNIDHKKYHDCKRTYWNIRHINDDLCKEHNLSVIRENQHKSKSYKEWQSERNGTSWKAQLKKDINETIKCSHTYEEFLEQMRAKGYEIKDWEISLEAHKYIGFRAPGQSRWIRGRAKSMGPDYTKERIRERIEEKARIRAERMKRLTTRSGSMIDTSQERFAESPGLMKWAERQNLKVAAKIQSELAGMGFKTLAEVDERITSLHQQAKSGKKTTVQLDKDIVRFEELLHFARVYVENKKYIKGYEKSKDKERYYCTHGYEIEIANGAIDRLKNAGLDPDGIDLHKMESDYELMKTDRANTSSAYQSAEKECERLKKLRDDLASYMGSEQSQEIERDKKRTL